MKWRHRTGDAVTVSDLPGTDEADLPGRTESSPRLSRRRILIGAGAALLLAGAGVGTAAAVGVLPGRSRKADDNPTTFTGATDEITRGDLQGETSHAGDRLYEMGDDSAYVMRGCIAAWRTFEPDMSKGSDVQQLQSALQAMGYFSLEPDGTFGWWTTKAIKAWQKDVGLEQNGTLPLGRIVFATDDLRVGSIKSRVGDRAASDGELYDVTSTAQVVEVNIKLADQQLGVVGNKVTLHLPGAVDTTGTITSVGTPTEKSGSGENKDSKERVIPVTVVPDDAAVTSDFQEVSITVGLPSEKRENVLSGPVAALIALSPEQFGIEVVQDDDTTKRVPVTTGLFAAGRVEVSGDDLAEGQHVVVPQR